MSFQLSSREVRIEGGKYLAALCLDSKSNWVTSQLDLDEYLGNVNGQFQWGSKAFSLTARNALIQSDHQTLQAELQNEYSIWPEATIDLGLHIANSNGVLTPVLPAGDTSAVPADGVPAPQETQKREVDGQAENSSFQRVPNNEPRLNGFSQAGFQNTGFGQGGFQNTGFSQGGFQNTGYRPTGLKDTGLAGQTGFTKDTALVQGGYQTVNDPGNELQLAGFKPIVSIEYGPTQYRCPQCGFSLSHAVGDKPSNVGYPPANAGFQPANAVGTSYANQGFQAVEAGGKRHQQPELVPMKAVQEALQQLATHAFPRA